MRPPGTGGVDHAPRVDVPARSNSISHVPGEKSSDPVAPAAGGAPGAFPALSLPGVAAADPAAALGLSPSRSIPDVTEAAQGVLGVHGLGAPLPEGPIVPGIGGLELAAPGELTPSLSGLTAPLPGEGVPGLPASDQLMGAGGLPNGPPDVTAATPAGSGFAPPPALPESVGTVPFTPAGGLSVPFAPGGELVPPLHGLSAPLPSAGLPGVPASDQAFTSAGVPGGPPEVTSVAPFGAAGAAGPPFPTPEGAAAPAGGSLGSGLAGMPSQSPAATGRRTSCRSRRTPISRPITGPRSPSAATSTTSST